MDIENLVAAIKLCGSTPRVDQCKNCTYWAGGDMNKCIPRMTLDAATALSTLQAENEKLRADLARVTAERDAAISDVEALMWFSGEGCCICAHAVEVHKEPYVRLDCDREKGTDCNPKWRGIKED